VGFFWLESFSLLNNIMIKIMVKQFGENSNFTQKLRQLFWFPELDTAKALCPVFGASSGKSLESEILDASLTAISFFVIFEKIEVAGGNRI
jgi:hypothetical protein